MILAMTLMKEYADSLIRLAIPKLGWASWQTVLAPIVGTIIAFVTEYIYHDAGALMFLVAIYAADFLTGVLGAIKNIELKSRKASNIGANLVAGVGLLCLSWWFAKFNPNVDSFFQLFGSTMSGTIYFILTSQNLLSIVENLCKMGVLPAQTMQVLQEYASLKRWFKKKDEPTPPAA